MACTSKSAVCLPIVLFVYFFFVYNILFDFFSVCDGFHYRTKRNFKENLKIIINVNKALTEILGQMRNRMKKIDTNLIRVKKNLEYMEDLYEGIFRKVNRLITSQDQSEEAQDHQIES